MINNMEVITINRTGFIGEKSIGQAKKVMEKIKSLRGEWYLILINKRDNQALELILVENGEIFDASYFKGAELQKAVRETRRFETNYIEMEVG